VDHYELHRSRRRDFVPSNETLIDGDVRIPSKMISGLDSGFYYYRVVAVDNVGLKSEPSNVARYSVSLFGRVEINGSFLILPGDYLEYQLVDVIDGREKTPDRLFATINGKRFQMYSLFRYYMTTVDSEDFFPVRGELYRKWMNVTARQLRTEYSLVSSDIDVAPFALTDDVDYQKQVFELYLTRYFGETKPFVHEVRRTWHADTFSSIDVYLHIFYIDKPYAEEFSDTNVEYDQAIFIVDANLGVLIEMNMYDERNTKGYSVKLRSTNIGLSRLQWWVAPLMIVLFLGIVAAILNQIVKKLERRI